MQQFTSAPCATTARARCAVLGPDTVPRARRLPAGASRWLGSTAWTREGHLAKTHRLQPNRRDNETVNGHLNFGSFQDGSVPKMQFGSACSWTSSTAWKADERPPTWACVPLLVWTDSRNRATITSAACLPGNDVVGRPSPHHRRCSAAGRYVCFKNARSYFGFEICSCSAPQARCVTIVFSGGRRRAPRASGQSAENCRRWRETAARSDGNCAPRRTGVLIPSLHAPRAREETRMNRGRTLCWPPPSAHWLSVAGIGRRRHDTAAVTRRERCSSSSRSRPPARSASASSRRLRRVGDHLYLLGYWRWSFYRGAFAGRLFLGTIAFSGDAFTAACSAIGLSYGGWTAIC